jgi:coenzyme F420-reducing hydrogenase delta subunit
VAAVLAVVGTQVIREFAIQHERIDFFDLKQDRAERIAVEHVAFNTFKHDIGELGAARLRM